jgi:hypothetical protein
MVEQTTHYHRRSEANPYPSNVTAAAANPFQNLDENDALSAT